MRFEYWENLRFNNIILQCSAYCIESIILLFFSYPAVIHNYFYIICNLAILSISDFIEES